MAGNHARRAALAHLIAGVAPLNLGGLPVGVAPRVWPSHRARLPNPLILPYVIGQGVARTQTNRSRPLVKCSLECTLN